MADVTTLALGEEGDPDGFPPDLSGIDFPFPPPSELPFDFPLPGAGGVTTLAIGEEEPTAPGLDDVF